MRFVFVDKIEKIEKNKFARGIKVISLEEGFLKSPYGEEGSFPQLLLLECAAQLTSWLVMYSTDFSKIPMLAKIERVSLNQNVKCGTRLTTEVRILSSNKEGALLNAEISDSDKLIAKGEHCLCVYSDLEKFADRSEMKARFLDLSNNAKLE